MKTRIMYIEYKGEELTGEARIGRVKFSKTGLSIHYNDKTFRRLGGQGFKANYFDSETEEEYWISGCKKNGLDRLYGERLPIYIDDDVREEYWTVIRNLPENKDIKVINGRSN
jgi:hypothetical protein